MLLVVVVWCPDVALFVWHVFFPKVQDPLLVCSESPVRCPPYGRLSAQTCEHGAEEISARVKNVWGPDWCQRPQTAVETAVTRGAPWVELG